MFISEPMSDCFEAINNSSLVGFGYRYIVKFVLQHTHRCVTFFYKKLGADFECSSIISTIPEDHLITTFLFQYLDRFQRVCLMYSYDENLCRFLHRESVFPTLPNVKTSSSGVEIVTERNAKARAAFDGEVIAVAAVKGIVKAVYVRHGDYITIYQNFDEVYVKKGDKVTTKQDLGRIYFNPTSEKTVLKFYVFQNDRKLNPAEWVYQEITHIFLKRNFQLYGNNFFTLGFWFFFGIEIGK